ncbi:hypothetical protein TNCT_79281 [Trichonephila clavata]|uniref:Uncharacterized protein n=1 Tax=Trichonephila clavata TaxID=2740835 RepID=A0A8X6LDP2_TRICU|nr:hypothetical protein TNCT_79281 [Trichonephila clavata]
MRASSSDRCQKVIERRASNFPTSRRRIRRFRGAANAFKPPSGLGFRQSQKRSRWIDHALLDLPSFFTRRFLPKRQSFQSEDKNRT